jgi:hypothetical protein
MFSFNGARPDSGAATRASALGSRHSLAVQTGTATDNKIGERVHFAGSRCVSDCDFCGETATLGGAAPLGEYRTLKSDFLYGFDAVAVVPLGSQQPLPAMCQAQPKLSIVFVMRVRGEFSALLDLVLEEVGCFDHCNHHNKSPAHRGFNEAKTRQLGICSDGSREEADQPRRSRGMP